MEPRLKSSSSRNGRTVATLSTQKPRDGGPGASFFPGSAQRPGRQPGTPLRVKPQNQAGDRADRHAQRRGVRQGFRRVRLVRDGERRRRRDRSRRRGSSDSRLRVIAGRQRQGDPSRGDQGKCGEKLPHTYPHRPRGPPDRTSSPHRYPDAQEPRVAGREPRAQGWTIQRPGNFGGTRAAFTQR
jgi:hypothetical protein